MEGLLLHRWRDFDDGIDEIKNEELRMNNDDEWYDLSGRRLDKPTKGINIIRMSDGTTKKVLMK